MSYTNQAFISGGKEVPSYEKNISICLGADGFSFAVTSVKDELLAYGAIAFEGCMSMSEAVTMVRSVWDEHKIVPMGYNGMELVIPSVHFVMVPDELYQPGNDRRYLESLMKIPMGLGVFCCHNESVGAQVVFTGDNNMVSAFKIAMPGIKVKCQYNKLANADLLKRSNMCSVMLLNMRGQAMDVVVYVNRRLQLVNTFPIASTQDALYHAVDVMKSLRLEDAKLEVLLCGDVERERYAEMAPYFPQADLYCGRTLKAATSELQTLHTYKMAMLLS